MVNSARQETHYSSREELHLYIIYSSLSFARPL